MSAIYYIELHIYLGVSIDLALKKGCQVAKQTKLPVRFEFNDHEIQIESGDDWKELKKKWDAGSKKRTISLR